MASAEIKPTDLDTLIFLMGWIYVDFIYEKRTKRLLNMKKVQKRNPKI